MNNMGLLDDKKRTNIAGYIISMWHVEDLMRANRFDMTLVEELLIGPMDADEHAKADARSVYDTIIKRMKEQGLERQGHLHEVEEVLNELEFLHNSLLRVVNDKDYNALFAAAQGDIAALQHQADEQADGPITTCFTAIYGVLLLRAQGKAVSPATSEAEGHFRRLLDALSRHYRQMRKLPGFSMN